MVLSSYRTWSAVMGIWYLFASLSLFLHPPGSESSISIEGDKRTIPPHQTFFQVVFGSSFWTALFFGVGLALVIVSLFARTWISRAHLVILVVVYIFGIGYVVNGLLTDAAFLAGAFALTSSTAHLVVARATKAEEDPKIGTV